MPRRRKTKQDVQLYTRREFVRAAGGAALTIGSVGFPSILTSGRRVSKTIVLAVDGMDPLLLQQYVKAGYMPNCRRLIESGMFSPLRTSDPPQSPVAWSNFIAGSNPGGHGIFDFIARDSATLRPYLSTSRTSPPKHNLRLGKYSLPLSPARTELLRKGPTLWNLLEDSGVESTAFKVPVNFPPTKTNARTLSGITTPDIHGSYGIFTFYSESPERVPGDVAGGYIERIRLVKGFADLKLPGPANSFRTDQSSVDIPFTLELDPARTMVKIDIQSTKLLLREGEWSDWVTVQFPMIAYLAETSGICRFYVKKTRPHLEIYVSPINIDPVDPAMPISTPPSYARELVEEVGHFYTQGMPEDTAALSARVFDDDDFRQQATFVLEERMRFFEHEMDNFDKGFHYFYFSSLDLDSHAFWRTIDPKHPMYSEELVKRHGDFLPWLYGRIDEAVGRAMQHLDENSLLFVVSDHGFVSFRRQFNLNSWLMDNGYARARNRFDRGHSSFFQDVNWGGTKAYGLGINSLYLNIRGREPDGTVAPGEEAENLREELIQRLKAVRDPETGDQVITNVYRPETIYSGPYVDMAPDLIVCYNRYYRASWDTILGKYPREHLLDNLDPWSGDHCMDSQFLSGVLMCNQKLTANAPALYDLAPTILSAYDIPVPGEMIGRSLLT